MAFILVFAYWISKQRRLLLSWDLQSYKSQPQERSTPTRWFQGVINTTKTMQGAESAWVVRKWYLNGNLNDKNEVARQTSGGRTFWADEQHLQRPWAGNQLGVFEKQKHHVLAEARVKREPWHKLQREAGGSKNACGLVGCSEDFRILLEVQCEDRGCFLGGNFWNFMPLSPEYTPSAFNPLLYLGFSHDNYCSHDESSWETLVKSSSNSC